MCTRHGFSYYSAYYYSLQNGLTDEKSPLLSGSVAISSDAIENEIGVEEGEREVQRTERDFQTIHVPGSGAAVSIH